MSATATVPEGMDALGHPVPAHRREAAYRALRADIAPGCSATDALEVVGRMVDCIERDEPYNAMKAASDAPFDRGLNARPASSDTPRLRLDVTAAYRLMAHLCAGGAA